MRLQCTFQYNIVMMISLVAIKCVFIIWTDRHIYSDVSL